MADIGDKVKIILKDGAKEGILMPSTDENTIIIKLNSGYNIGIDKKNIKKIESVEAKLAKNQEKAGGISEKKGLPTIAILHTGGTIASSVDYRTGAVEAKFTPEDLIRMFPELKETANIRSRLVSNMWSDDMRFGHYNTLAIEVEKEAKQGVDGVIITHGTDTMHYTSAALAFALENLGIPVILAGAQRSSDAAMNLICAARFIAKADFAEVGICMHMNMSDDVCNILPGTKARKMHSSRRDAFKAINDKPIAYIDYNSGEIRFEKKDYNKKDKSRKIELKLFNEKLKVGILRIHTHMHPEQFLAYRGFDGLVIEGSGLGHTPMDVIDDATKIHESIRDAIKELASYMPVVMATQTIFGRIDMSVYSKGRDLMALGLLGNYSDMAAETAFIKLAWLLSNYKREQVKDLVTRNFRGEITERSEIKEKFI